MQLLNAMLGKAAKYGMIPASIQSRYIRAALEALHENFELVAVTNSALADEAARIRYEVYCEDYTGYESPEKFADHKENDAFDVRSLQVLLRFKPEGLFIGTVRLVTPLSDEKFLESYPTQTLCQDPLFQDKEYIIRTCEVSRFCMSKKRRDNLQKFLDPKTFASVRPVLNAALITGITQTALEHGYNRVCGVLEPWLIEKLKKSGWSFNEVGPLVDFHGLRQPCEGSVTAGLEGIKQKFPDVWEYMVGAPPLWRNGDASYS